MVAYNKKDDWHFMYATQAAQTIFQTKKELLPTFIGYDHQDQAHVITTAFADDQEKYKCLGMLRAYFMLNNVQHYMVLHEAWLSSYKTKEDIGNNPTPPSQDPNRKEALICMSINPHRKLLRAYPIDRDQNNNPTLNTNTQQQEFEDIQGPFTQLLDTTDIPPVPDHIDRKEVLERIAQALDIHIEQIHDHTPHHRPEDMH
jgi:hypothetical protein